MSESDDVIVSFSDVAPWLMPKRLEKRVEQQIASVVNRVPAFTDQTTSAATVGQLDSPDTHDTPAGWD